MAEAGLRTRIAGSGTASRAVVTKSSRPLAVAGAHWKANLRAVVRSRAASLRTSAGVRYGPNPVTIESLLAKRALNPRRFDRNHPGLGPILVRAQKIRDGLICGYGTGLIYLTPYHRYLLAKRALNPDRFDHYHPILGAILAEHIRVRDTPCDNGGGTPGGGGEGGGNNGGGGNGGGEPGELPQLLVPEPSSVVIAMIGLASLGLVAARKKTRPGAGQAP
jgi:hypothetical protein